MQLVKCKQAFQSQLFVEECMLQKISLIGVYLWRLVKTLPLVTSQPECGLILNFVSYLHIGRKDFMWHFSSLCIGDEYHVFQFTERETEMQKVTDLPLPTCWQNQQQNQICWSQPCIAFSGPVYIATAHFSPLILLLWDLSPGCCGRRNKGCISCLIRSPVPQEFKNVASMAQGAKAPVHWVGMHLILYLKCKRASS